MLDRLLLRLWGRLRLEGGPSQGLSVPASVGGSQGTFRQGSASKTSHGRTGDPEFSGAPLPGLSIPASLLGFPRLRGFSGSIAEASQQRGFREAYVQGTRSSGDPDNLDSHGHPRRTGHPLPGGDPREAGKVVRFPMNSLFPAGLFGALLAGRQQKPSALRPPRGSASKNRQLTNPQV